MRVGIVTEFPSRAVQSGPAIHSRFLHDGLVARGHEVVMMGPNTAKAAEVDVAEAQLYPSVAYPTHPRVRIALPGSPRKLFNYDARLDVIHGQTSSNQIQYAMWLRRMHGIPALNTHVVHFPTHCHFLVSDRLWENEVFRNWWVGLAHDFEKNYVFRILNEGDGLIVQSRYLVDYWRERGVTVPIYVVGRPINPALFSKQPSSDPFPKSFRAGRRLLVVCRHDREKRLPELIDIFARHIAPAERGTTLTLVGGGHEHEALKDYAAASGAGARIHFAGEVKHESLVDWYAHADLFVYTSLSETFGNVVNEALWSGLPVLAMDDQMGVAGQVVDGVNGVLVDPHSDGSDEEFAAHAMALLTHRERRRQMGEAAANLARRTAHPDVVMGRFETLYAEAKEHCRRTLPVPLKHRSKREQWRAFLRAIGQWGFWDGLMVTTTFVATKLGVGRKVEASAHLPAEEKQPEQSSAWTRWATVFEDRPNA